MSHAQLAASVIRTAACLRKRGIRRGDRVLVQLPNSLELAVLLLALCRMGTPAVLASPMLRSHELDRIAAIAEPTAVAVPGIVNGFDYLNLARALRSCHSSIALLLVTDRTRQLQLGEAVFDAECGRSPEPAPAVREEELASPSETALYVHSTGTTGPAKLMARTHEDYGCLIRATSKVLGVSSDWVYLAALQLTHTFALSNPGFFGVLAAGGTVVIAPANQMPEALRLIEREGVTHTSTSPAGLRQLLAVDRTGRDLSTLQVVQVGGAILQPHEVRAAAHALGCHVQQVYGMSEGMVSLTRLDDSPRVLTCTQGRPAAVGTEIRITTGSGISAAPGEAGELLTRGPSVIPGYFRDPPATRQAFTEDGFYRTGDLVKQDESGNLTVVGRIKNLISWSGLEICAEELEALAGVHPAVADCAAVGKPHDIYGETVCLFLTLRPGQDPPLLEEMQSFLKEEGIAVFKLPQHMEVLDALPMVGNGKADRAALRSLAASLACSRPHPDTGDR
ncbi:(2,3-dihydroxybenzoyl)adenylate synthase [Streptomyces blastmyceticus]|uniref:Long-chain-fatty-acid--CoA ligase n=2 Tax=Streptomyces blastmyceticus TaxID=68180 RepID=A0ABN0WTA6_9ACTN